MTKKKPKKKRPRYRVKKLTPSRVTKPVRFSPEELAQVQAKADKWADGNFSAFVRLATTHYTPDPKLLEKVA